MTEAVQRRQRKLDYSHYAQFGAVLMFVGGAMFAAGVRDGNAWSLLELIVGLTGLGLFLIGVIAPGVELGIRAAGRRHSVTYVHLDPDDYRPVQVQREAGVWCDGWLEAYRRAIE